ncbi:MAG: AI-2E family transporter [Thermoanaerobaculia bacterium]
MKRFDPAVVRLLAFVAALALVALLLVFFGDILQPLLLGMAIAYLLDPAVSWLARRGVSRPFGAVLIGAVAVLAVALALVLLVPMIVEEVRGLTTRLPDYHAALRARVEPWIAELEARYPTQVAEARARIVATVNENLPGLAARIAGWLGSFFASVLGFVLFLLNLVFVPVFAFYLLVDWPRLRQSLLDLVPVPYRAVTVERLLEVNAALGSFLRGQLTIALILAAINATGLVLLGVPFGLVVGLVAGLANLVPYMALVVGLVPALLLSWAEHQSWLHLLGVAAVFTGAQVLEGTVLSPRILARHVDLHPVVVLLAVIVGGSFFGFLGMLVAVPTVAACQVFVRHWVAQYKRSVVYRGEGDEAPRESAGAS